MKNDNRPRAYRKDTLLTHLGRNPEAQHGAINPPVVGDTTERTGIPIDGSHPTKAPVVRDTGDYIGIPYVGTGPAADIIRGGYVDTNGR